MGGGYHNKGRRWILTRFADFGSSVCVHDTLVRDSGGQEIGGGGRMRAIRNERRLLRGTTRGCILGIGRFRDGSARGDMMRVGAPQVQSIQFG